MKPKSSNSTASIMDKAHCNDCGWPLISTCCNDEMADLHPLEDWWLYCSNQGCKNHAGEPFGQEHTPSFLVRI